MNSESESNEHLIEFIETSFGIVNNKIGELLECSVKDFIYLNSNFKKYYSQLNSISDTTEDFFSFIESISGDTELANLCSEAKLEAEKLSESNKLQLRNFKELNNKYNFILLNLNNLKQDLSTLRLLFTNLRFDPLFKSDQQDTNNCLDNISNCYNDCSQIVNKVIEKLTKVIDFSGQGYSNGLDFYIDIVEKTIKQANQLNDLGKSSKKYKDQLKHIEEKKSISTSEIITNLQFQDILRQKIEHIQEAHSRITASLYSEHKKGETLNPKELYQIRDISSLQSAQLIHANQEYQTAVENILKRISNLKQVVNSYNNICLHFCNPEKNKIQNIIGAINDELSLLNTQTFSLDHISEKYYQLISEIPNFKQEIESKLSSIHCTCNGISELNEIINTSTETLVINEKYDPISQLRAELIKFNAGYKKLLSLFNDLEFDQFQKSTFSSENKISVDSLKVFTSKIEEKTKNISKYIDKNHSLFEVSLDTIEVEVEKVTYYKTFEKETIEIIQLLDKILENINFNNTDIDESSLEQLKEMYTMQSERDVHESIIEKKKAENLKNNNTNNEVEFF